MRLSDQELISALHKPKPKLSIYEWARRNIDYAKVYTYDTQYRGIYNPDYLPWYKEIQDKILDRGTKEIYILKATRAGASEAIFTALRYMVAESPRHILYISGQQSNVEAIFRKRIKLGLKLSDVTRDRYRLASETEHLIELPDMDIACTWPKCKTGYKSSGYQLVIMDELSLYPDYSVDLYRKRGDTYAFSKIIGLSSMDPTTLKTTDLDPIYIEWGRGTKREWVCTDCNGQDFVFSFGVKGKYGLQYEGKRDDGKYDLKTVRETAYYLTPSGAKIYEQDRMQIVRAGHWSTPTNQEARQGVESYRITAMMLPWASCSLPELAVSYVEARAKGDEAIRRFYYESLAEPYYIERKYANESALVAHKKAYARGTSLWTNSIPVLTVDVQKLGMYWLVRGWSKDGESCLIDCGFCSDWQGLQAIRAKYGCTYMFCDSQYRTDEVKEAAKAYKFMPLSGADSQKDRVNARKEDIYANTLRAGNPSNLIQCYSWSTRYYRLKLLGLIADPKTAWYVHNSIDSADSYDYSQQVTSIEYQDGAFRQIREADHYYDCECMQLVAASIIGIFKDSGQE
jgi:phage terminase large subunit GpA-like protein